MFNQFNNAFGYGVAFFLAVEILGGVGIIALEVYQNYFVDSDLMPIGKIIWGTIAFIGMAIGMVILAIFFPFQCVLGIGYDEEICTSSVAIHQWISYGGLVAVSLSAWLSLPDKSGVPPIYRFITSFFVHRTSLVDQARRATAHHNAPTFNADAAGLGKDHPKPTNAYEESLHKEKVEEALEEVNRSIKKMQEREQNAMQKRKERLKLEEEFARKIKEAEELKARLSELGKDK